MNTHRPAFRAPAEGLGTVRLAPDQWESVPDWDEVVEGAQSPSVFLTRDWVSSWWRSFGREFEPFLLRVGDSSDATIGLAPLYVERIGPVRRLAVIGDSHAGSEYLGVIARAGAESEVARAVIKFLLEAGGWDICELRGLREGDEAAAVLIRTLHENAIRAETTPPHPCSRVVLPSSFESYLASLASKFRQTYRQRANKLLRTHSVRFAMTASDDDIDAHLDRLFEMHQAHWTAIGFAGSFSDVRMRSFYRDVSRAFLAKDRLRFWHLEVDGVIRASQFGFVYDGVLHSLQEAYDPSFRAPGVGGLGVILRGHVLATAIEEGLVAYDFLGGDEDFKQRWGTTTQYVRTVRAHRPGSRGRVVWSAMKANDSARAVLKEVVPKPVVRKARVLQAQARTMLGSRRH